MKKFSVDLFLFEFRVEAEAADLPLASWATRMFRVFLPRTANDDVPVTRNRCRMDPGRITSRRIRSETRRIHALPSVLLAETGKSTLLSASTSSADFAIACRPPGETGRSLVPEIRSPGGFLPFRKPADASGDPPCLILTHGNGTAGWCILTDTGFGWMVFVMMIVNDLVHSLHPFSIILDMERNPVNPALNQGIISRPAVPVNQIRHIGVNEMRNFLKIVFWSWTVVAGLFTITSALTDPEMPMVLLAAITSIWGNVALVLGLGVLVTDRNSEK